MMRPHRSRMSGQLFCGLVSLKSKLLFFFCVNNGEATQLAIIKRLFCKSCIFHCILFFFLDCYLIVGLVCLFVQICANESDV